MENMESGYVEALELERMKMLVFGRELPLSVQLVSRVIEKYKQQRLSVPLSEETTSNDRGPVLEFIPMKNSPINTFAFSPEISGDHHQQDLNQQPCPSEKSDWLRSVQLWNQTPNLTNEPSRRESDADRKGSYNTGMEKSAESGSTDHAKNQNQLGKRVGVSKTDICEESMKRKQRRCWSQELHKRFLHSLRQLGGPHVATPKQIRELMKVDGLTNDEVKSHLQKYRLHTRRPAMSHDQDNNGHNTQATQFMVVGGIWVPPSSDYPTMSLANREEVNTDSGSPPMDGVYTPMAAPHSWVQFNQEPQIKMNKNSDGHGDALARCISPSMSSSTRTTASPIY